MDTTKLNINLIAQLRDEFENPAISPCTSDWEKGVNLLFDISHFSNFNYEFVTALEDVLLNKPTDYNALVQFASYLENYLSRIGHFLGRLSDREEWTLMPLLKELKLQKKCPDFTWDKLARYENQPNFLAHFCRAYCTRNDIAHSEKDGSLPSWEKNQLSVMQNRNSILVVMVYATLVHYEALQLAIERRRMEHPNVESYITAVIDNFKRWERLFVSIHAKETEKIELFVQEETDGQDRKPRNGSIESLWQEVPKLMLVGDAGMGKTTTLQYLAYEDAVICQKNSEHSIPLYLEFKLLGNMTLRDRISDELRRFPPDFVETRLQNGKLNLFLDGLNELTNDSKITDVEHQIQDLINHYPNLRLIISSRATNHRFILSEEERVPVFGLNKMRNNQIEDFLDKNATESVAAAIHAEMDDADFVDWLRIPMLLKMIIEVVEYRLNTEQDDPIPENTTELTGEFIEKLYLRETERDSRFSENTFEALAAHLAMRIVEKNSNAAIVRSEVVSILSEKVSCGFPNADLDYFLRVATEIGILTVHNKTNYSFAHEKYLDFYQAKGFKI
jgi:DNA polymerase III delta prime subunit